MPSRKTVCLRIAILLVFLFAGLIIYKTQPNMEIQGEESPVSSTGFYFNTSIKITLYDSRDSSLLDQCMELCETYENLFSRTDPDSELYRLNHRQLPETSRGYEVSDDTARLIKKGLKYCRLSGGAFDITIAPVSDLWDFTSGSHQIPSASDLQEAASHVNYQNVSVEGNYISFQDPDIQIDLGAIAKGYIADQLKDYLVSQKVTSAIINLGGNVLCIGSHTDGTPFQIGLQKPFSDRNTTVSTLNISDCSVVSSGIYERYFEKDDTIYHHLLNPRTGYPYQNGLVSVTIVSESSADGDGLSTSCFALGLEKGMELAESLPDTYACFITEDGTLHYSRGFEEKFLK